MQSGLVEMINISKQFNGHDVLRSANFVIRSGEVCSLLGENGAGKTTLMKVLAGVCRQDSGRILFDGNEVDIGSPIASQKLGIRMIFQETQLIDFFSVEKNIFIGRELCFPYTPFINRKLQIEKANEIFAFLQTKIDVKAPVGQLSFAQKKMVEIAKALLMDVNVLILDEVTAFFTEPETQKLFHIIEKLKERGIAVVFISHKIEEVIRISDRIVILRDGETVEETPGMIMQDTNTLIEKMAGEDFVNRYPKTKAKKGRKILELKGVTNKLNTVKDVSFYLRSGEIVGFAGLQGAGKSSLTKMLAGIEDVSSGHILIGGKPVSFSSPCQAVKKGIAYFSENNENNISMIMDTPYNITLSNLDCVKRLFIISSRLEDNVTKFFIKHLNMRIPDAKMQVRFLSRGTQQKVAISKWLYADANILIMDEPSVNLDINSKVELYNILNKLSHKSKGIIIASSDLRELIGMCDRIYVMLDGRIVSEMKADEANTVRILSSASGKLPAAVSN